MQNRHGKEKKVMTELEVLVHGSSFKSLIATRRIHIPPCDTNDPELAYRVISGLYARRLCWRLSFMGDEDVETRLIWEKVSMIRMAHHYLRAGKLVTVGDECYMGFFPCHVRVVEELINQKFSEFSIIIQGEHVFSLDFVI